MQDVRRSALRIAVLYVLVAALWIIFSDRVVLLLNQDLDTNTTWQTYKGLFFVFFTGLLLLVERYYAGKAIYLTSQRFQWAVESIPDTIVLYDADLRIQYINKIAREIANRSESDLIGKRDEEILPQAVVQTYLPTLQEALRTGEVRSLVSDLKMPDGRIYYYQYTCIPLLDEEGQVQEVLSIKHDETEHMRSEEQARYHALLLENISDAVIGTDIELNVQAWNKAAEEIYGWTAEEVLGQPVDVLLGSEYERATYEEMRTRFLEDGFWQGEMSQYDKTGKRIWVSGSINSVYDFKGEKIGAVAVNKDVTARKETEEKLKRRAHQLSVLHNIDRIILAMQSVDSILHTVLELIRELIPCELIGVTLLDDERQEVEIFIVHQSGKTAVMPSQRLPFDFQHNQAWTAGETTLINDLSETSAQNVIQQTWYEEGIRSMLNVPLIAHNELIGTLDLGGGEAHHFSAEDVQVAQDIAVQVSVAIENARLVSRLKRRVNELDTIHQVSQRLQQVLVPEVLAEEIIHILEDVLEYEYGGVFLIRENDRLVPFALSTPGTLSGSPVSANWDQTMMEDLQVGQGIVGWVAQHAESVCLGNVPEDPRYDAENDDIRSELCVPLKIGKHVIGVVNIKSFKPSAYTVADQRLLETMAAQIAIAVQNSQLLARERDSQDQLRKLANYLQEALEAERAHIAREIHDEFGQMLTALKMDTIWLHKRLHPDRAEIDAKLAGMVQLIDRAVQTVRDLASELRPGLLDDLGLVAAIEWYSQQFGKRTGVVYEINLASEYIALNSAATTAVFRIFQEALTNIARHADATRVTISLSQTAEGFLMTVQDNGSGITEPQLNSQRSLGLIGMKERARAFGGTLDIETVLGQGTHVMLRLPPTSYEGDAR